MNKIAFSKKQISVLIHLLGWMFLVITPLYFNNVYGDGNVKGLYHTYLYIVIYGTIFYANYLIFVPRLFLEDKRMWFVLAAAAVVFVLYFVHEFLYIRYIDDPEQRRMIEEIMKNLSKTQPVPKPPFKEFHIFSYTITSFLLTGFALGLGVTEKLAQNEKRRKELEKEKLNSELAFLKNQVSPHFFFNTLNNIYSLISIDGPTAQESVLKLSKLMRYLLYESEQGESLMSQEINFMNNYIDLMKLRLNSKVDLSVNFPEKFTDFSIPPLLFISFIENAFKHGISYRERSFIKIEMAIDQDQILFKTENSIGKSSQTGDLQHSGIGLENVRKRLALLFHGRHELSINQTDTVFKVELIIQKNKTTNEA